MLTVPEAIEAVLASVRDLGMETVNVEQAVGRVLREPVYADRDYPPINRATMDGIAINSSSWDNEPRAWNIETTIAAGSPSIPLNDTARGCVQIMTGADVPENCDTVIPVEEISVEDGKAIALPEAKCKPGQYIHARSSDRKAGDQLLSEGALLTPPRIAIMGSVGHARVHVANLPRVAVVSTGDEIAPINQTIIAPTQVRASNLVGIQSALKAMGIDTVSTHHIVDDFEATTDRIIELIEKNDILILSGGVSKGKFDYVPAALEKAGVKKIFHRVAQRPGKPLWFGHSDTCTVFGLPGNPVSTLTVFRRYVVPFLLKSADCEPETHLNVSLEGENQPHDTLTLLLPVKLMKHKNGHAAARLVTYHGSGDFAALSESDGFVEIPPGDARSEYSYYSW